MFCCFYSLNSVKNFFVVLPLLLTRKRLSKDERKLMEQKMGFLPPTTFQIKKKIIVTKLLCSLFLTPLFQPQLIPYIFLLSPLLHPQHFLVPNKQSEICRARAVLQLADQTCHYNKRIHKSRRSCHFTS